MSGSEAIVAPPTLMASTIANAARNRLAILLPRLTLSSAAARSRACATPKRFRAASSLAEVAIRNFENVYQWTCWYSFPIFLVIKGRHPLRDKILLKKLFAECFLISHALFH